MMFNRVFGEKSMTDTIMGGEEELLAKRGLDREEQGRSTAAKTLEVYPVVHCKNYGKYSMCSK